MNNKVIPSFTAHRTRLNPMQKNELCAMLDKYRKVECNEIKRCFTQGGYKNIHLEIGSGFGDTIINLAQNNSRDLFIAAEVYQDALFTICHKMQAQNVSNIVLYNQDARELFELDVTFQNLYILFPDPWPKRKHHKRRIITIDFLHVVHTKICPGGSVYIASDHPSYQEHISRALSQQKLFSFTESQNAPSWWYRTKFQEKGENKGQYAKFFTLTKA